MSPAFLTILVDSLLPWSVFVAGLFVPMSFQFFRNERYVFHEIALYLSLPGIIGLLALFFSPDINYIVLLESALMIFLGVMVSALIYRHVVPAINASLVHLTHPSKIVEADKKTDIRTVAECLPTQRQEYDPRQYFIKNAIFFGLDEKMNVLYVKGEVPHMSVVGPTGLGKGRILQILAWQWLLAQETVIYLDPKNDEWMPHVLFAACQAANVPYHFINLNPEGGYQFNILQDATVAEIDDLFQSIFSLGSQGGDADFYRAKDRAASRVAAVIAAENGLTIELLYYRLISDPDLIEEAPGFIDSLAELSRLPAINSRSGAFSLKSSIEKSMGVYVVGSMINESVRRAQRMIFVRIQQIASARPRMSETLRTICVIGDEAAHHLSRPVVGALGASRDKGIRIVLAFQNLGNLRQVPQDMDADGTVNEINGNTKIKLVYQLIDPDSRAYFASLSGSIPVVEESRIITRNWALGETASDERTTRKGERFLIDENMLASLPYGWGAFYGGGLARLCNVGLIKVPKTLEAHRTVNGEGPSDLQFVDKTRLEFPKKNKKYSKKSGKPDDSKFFSLD